MLGTNPALPSRAAVCVKVSLLLCLAAASGATPLLPSPSTLAECVDVTVLDDPSSCLLAGNNALASASLTISPFVNLTAQSSSGPADQFGVYSAGALDQLNYSFQVVGGTPGDVVPILIATNLTSSASSFSHAYGFAQVLVHTAFGTGFETVCTNGTCGTSATSFSGAFGWSAISGDIDAISVEAEATSGDSPFAEAASASADPFIFIDPSFAGASNYSIVVSPGVGNGVPTTTPEPGTLALAGATLIAMGLWRRSRGAGGGEP